MHTSYNTYFIRTLLTFTSYSDDSKRASPNKFVLRGSISWYFDNSNFADERLSDDLSDCGSLTIPTFLPIPISIFFYCSLVIKLCIAYGAVYLTRLHVAADFKSVGDFYLFKEE